MIDVNHLRMEYDGTVALENLQLQIPRGEVFGLIGPNGAGKTTLIRILATLLEPTYGEVRIGGIDVLAEPLRVHPLVGYMSDFFSLYDHMLTWEYLDHFARCYNVEPKRRNKLIDEVLDLVSLEVRRDAEIQSLSRGMRQRLCFAKSLLHEPEVLLLDEPASGLDPAGRLEFRVMLRNLQQMGRTILISSHILTEMTEFCTSIGILETGTMLASGRVDEILARLEPDLLLQFEVLGSADRLTSLLEQHQDAQRIETPAENRLRCHWKGPRDELPALHRQIVEAGIDLVALEVKRDNLEDIYMKISGHRTS